MNYLTETQVEDFFSTLSKKYHREEFYNLLLDYLDTNKIIINDSKDEEILEQEIFNIAKERGFIGYDVIQEIFDMNKFLGKMNMLVDKNAFNLYHNRNERPSCRKQNKR